MPLVQTRGAASAQGFGEFAQSGPVNYIEEVFSTYLYKGNSSTQTITNNIDLSTKGGLLWVKNRTGGALDHYLYDTVRGGNKYLGSNTTAAESTANASDLTGITSTGFTLGFVGNDINNINKTYASWTFREQAKFFDVVTYTGTGSARTVAHNLGSVPGCIIVKRTDTAGFDWPVYHRSIGNTNRLLLNDTVSSAADSGFWNNTTPTSSVFTVGSNVNTNGSGGTYIAYIFAHDAGGFGLTGTDNVLSCGSFTIVSNVASVTLGYEPQWTMIKRTDATDSWIINDVMRGSPTAGGQNKTLYANLADVESGGTAGTHPTATGFTVQGLADGTYIYIAIRRGPMAVPTDATKVFNPNTSYSTISSGTFGVTTGFPVDALLWRITAATAANYENGLMPRLTGGRDLKTYSTDAEAANILGTFDYNTQVAQQAVSTGSQIYLSFRRVPSFFDVVCDTGTGVAKTVAHNLTVTPQLWIRKCRNTAGTNWFTFHSFGVSTCFQLYLNDNSTNSTVTYGVAGQQLEAAPTATLLSLKDQTETNASGRTYVNYLFATCAGVSKVGTYTGTGTTQTINCGFTAGSRFVMIKRTDSNGDWYVWDSARGIIAGNDPYLLINSTAAEVTSTDYVDTANSGFEISSTAPAAINANGGTFIFLAIA